MTAGGADDEIMPEDVVIGQTMPHVKDHAEAVKFS